MVNHMLIVTMGLMETDDMFSFENIKTLHR